MLFVVFKPLDVKKQAHFPPYIIKINKQLLNSRVIQFKRQVHKHFKPYISPFINEENLKLGNKQTECMFNTLPLYMYIDPGQYSQYIECTTQPNILSQQEQKWRFAKNWLIYKISGDEKIYNISQKDQNSIQNMMLKIKLKKKDMKMIINGQIIQRIDEQQSWNRFWVDNWKDFGLDNECVYVRFY